MIKTLEQLKRGDVLTYISGTTGDVLFGLFISCGVHVDYSFGHGPRYSFLFNWLDCSGFVRQDFFASVKVNDKDYMTFTSSKEQKPIIGKQAMFFYLDDSEP